MTQEFKEMLVLLGYASRENSTDFNIISDCNLIMEKAKEQGVFQLVFGALKIMHNEGKVHVDNFENINRSVMLSCNKNALKISSFYSVITKFEEEKIKYALIKGDTLSSLYRFPALRVSGDIDVLIDIENEVRVLQIMSECGFSYSPRSKSSNHTVCVHPLIGIVEVHISLYYDFIASEWFKGIDVQEEFRKIKLSDGNECYTLSINDGYVYLLLHTIKHFLSNGLTVKQILDVVLYAEKYIEQIDFIRVNEELRKLKYINFAECIFYIAAKYFGVDVFKIDEKYDSIAEKLLSDCEDSGAFGRKKHMGNFYEIYNKERIKSNGNVDFNEFMTRWRRESLKDYLSFSKESMKTKYPSLTVMKARTVHFGNIVVKCLKYRKKIPQFIKYKSIAKTTQFSERLDIIKELDMI